MLGQGGILGSPGRKFGRFPFRSRPLADGTAAIPAAAAVGGLRQIGAMLEMDLGTGALEIVPHTQLGETLSLYESLDGFGAITLSFTMYGLQSPIESGLLRGMRRATLTLYWGPPGSITSAVMFDGYLFSAQWQHDTRSATVRFQDESLRFANQRVFYTLAPFSGKTRGQIVNEVAAAMGLPISGSVAANGTVYKGINEGGDHNVLDFISQLIAPAGSRAYWRNGNLQIGPAGLSTPVATLKIADIRGAIRVTPPATNTPNSVEFTSAIYPQPDGAQGYTETVVTDDTNGAYTPAGSFTVQDHVTGTISAHVVSPGAETLISRVITTTRKWGTTEIGQDVEEWGWYAPKACSKQLLPTGSGTLGIYQNSYPATIVSGTDYTLSWNPSFDVYEFGAPASGDWRSHDRETFMVVKRTHVNHEFDSLGRRILTGTVISAFGAHELPIGWALYDIMRLMFNPRPLNGGPPIVALADNGINQGTVVSFPYLHADGSPWIVYGNFSYAPNVLGTSEQWAWADATGNHFGTTTPRTPIFVTADGHSWLNGQETIAAAWPATGGSDGQSESQTTLYTIADDGAHLKVAASRVYPFYGTYDSVWRLSGAAFTAPTDPATSPPGQIYVLGPTATPRWCDGQADRILGSDTWAIEYVYVSPGNHNEITTLAAVTRSLSMANQPDTMTLFTVPAAGTVGVATDWPLVVTRSMVTSGLIPARVTMPDDVLTAMNGVIPAYASSDFCESLAEMRVAARTALRETCSPVVDFDRGPDGTIHVGDTVAVQFGPMSSKTENLKVIGISTQLNLRTGEATQTISSRWFPPELESDS